MPEFEVFIHVARPPAAVYEAVADPAKLSHYFTTGGAEGRIEAGATVRWEFADFPGRFPVEVTGGEPPVSLAFRWPANEDGKPAGYSTDVSFGFESVDDGTRTKVTVAEKGWPDTEAGRKASYGNCMGWAQMLAALKAWVEYDINLREGAYK
jgi:uncharacterized protein YndB with AHSA1/START domain